MKTDEGTVMAPPTIGEAATDQGEPALAPHPSASVPVLAGRYRLGRLIGKGGMGEVMGARDEQVGRDVAIKRMRAAAPDERAIQRFLREASIQGRLEHPAIVSVHEIGRDGDGLPFFVMKKLAGTTLGEIDHAGILLRAPAVGGAEGPAILVGVLYTIGPIIGACAMAHAMRARTRAAHRHLHVQAWQLRQLVPQ